MWKLLYLISLLIPVTLILILKLPVRKLQRILFSMLALAILAYLFLFTSLNPFITPPTIVVETLQYNFGDIPQQKVEKVLWVKNGGASPLEIKNVSTSCGCTTAAIDKTNINPGESANLTITFDPNIMGEVGPVEKVVYVRSNDPANEEVAITIKMNAVPEKSPSPSPIAFECPKEKFINCKPGPDMLPEKQKLCSGEYHQWIKKNCPNAEFAY